ncbi:MAG TPA: PLDc N-terminal domain-containing protein [Anaerolineae bacterium]
MERLIPMIVVLPLLVFWAWMFWDLTNNDDLPNNAKWNWTLAFVFLNVFAAVFYYFYQYRNRH